MNYATIQEAIRVAVRDALGFSDMNDSGRPSHAVVWERSKEAGTYRPALRADLLLRAPVGVGTDETRFEYDGGSDQNVPSQTGIRMLPVQIKIESDTQAPGAEESVGGLGGRLRTRLYRSGVLAALRAAGVALNSIGPTIEREYKRDSRLISVSITEVLFSAAENDTDTSTGAGDYIARVNVKSYNGATPTLLADSGDPAREQINVTIPPEEE